MRRHRRWLFVKDESFYYLLWKFWMFGTLSLFPVLVLVEPVPTSWSTPCWSASSTRRPWTSMVMWHAWGRNATTWCRQRSNTSSFTRRSTRPWLVARRKSTREICTLTSRNWRRLNRERPSQAWRTNSRWERALFIFIWVQRSWVSLNFDKYFMYGEQNLQHCSTIWQKLKTVVYWFILSTRNQRVVSSSPTLCTFP